LASGGGGGGNTTTQVLNPTTTTAPPPTTTTTPPTTTTTPPTTSTVPTSTDPTDPNTVPTLDAVYKSDSGPQFSYPANWKPDKTARRDTPKETFFEYVALASHTLTDTPMYVRVVFGPSPDFHFFGSVNSLVDQAKKSVRNSPFDWNATFLSSVANVTIDGSPGAVLGFSWKGKGSTGTEGAGYLFAARNNDLRKWIYGWAAYDTQDREEVGESRIDTRRTTLSEILDTIHWNS